jgi:asparaginyl-tRNA synthetase
MKILLLHRTAKRSYQSPLCRFLFTSRVNDVLLSTPVNSDIKVSGWIRTARIQKSFSFLELNDGSSSHNLQVVWPSTSDIIEIDKSSNASISSQLNTGSYVEVTATLVSSPKAGQRVEAQAKKVKVIGTADGTAYPLQKKSHSAEYMREILHLRSRSNVFSAVLRLRSSLSFLTSKFFAENKYTQIHTPVLTSNDCEGAGELFAVESASNLPKPALHPLAVPGKAVQQLEKFFGKDVYLTVSGQLHLEAFACGMGNVYTFGPTFRAENSHTTRHLAEFWMLEAELAPGNALSAMQVLDKYLHFCVSSILKENSDEIKFFTEKVDPTLQQRLERIVSVPEYPIISYIDAVKILQTCGVQFQLPVVLGEGLSSEHEKYLCEVYTGGVPLFVKDYPASIKPFYMRKSDGGAPFPTVGAFDLLVPTIGELAGGSAREERYEVLLEEMRSRNLLSPDRVRDVASSLDKGFSSPVASCNDPSLDWYLDLRRFGSVPHAGWGLGFERLVLLLSGMTNIRDVIPVPRVPGSCRL